MHPYTRMDRLRLGFACDFEGVGGFLSPIIVGGLLTYNRDAMMKAVYMSPLAVAFGVSQLLR